jgi:LysM repeat protein
MLKMRIGKWYQVKEGQTVADISKAFCVSERLLVQENGLTEEPKAGQILKIPQSRGNAYVARAGDTKKLLCGSDENYRKKNGTDILYIGMRVIL